jgi:pullulanase
MDKLCAAIVLTSQGIAFLHAGEEFLRTKRGHENSYNLPDAINRLDWDRKSRHRDVVAYYLGLIALRKAHPAFRMRRAADIRRFLRFLNAPGPDVVVFLIRRRANGHGPALLVAYNGGASKRSIALPHAPWDVLVDDRAAGITPLRRIEGRSAVVPGHSALVLAAAT